MDMEVLGKEAVGMGAAGDMGEAEWRRWWGGGSREKTLRGGWRRGASGQCWWCRGGSGWEGAGVKALGDGMLEGLRAVIHGGDNAVPVEKQGLRQRGKKKVSREVGELFWDRLGFGWVMGWKETLTKMASGDWVVLEFVEGDVVGVEVGDVGEDVVVYLGGEEAANAEVKEVESFGGGSRWVERVEEGSADRRVVRGGSGLRWWAMFEDGGLEGVLIGGGAGGI